MTPNDYGMNVPSGKDGKIKSFKVVSTPLQPTVEQRTQALEKKAAQSIKIPEFAHTGLVSR